MKWLAVLALSLLLVAACGDTYITNPPADPPPPPPPQEWLVEFDWEPIEWWEHENEWALEISGIVVNRGPHNASGVKVKFDIIGGYSDSPDYFPVGPASLRVGDTGTFIWCCATRFLNPEVLWDTAAP